MNALTVILLVVTVIYLWLYQTNYWKYFFGILIPYYLITQILLNDFKTNTPKRKFYITSWIHPFDSQIYAKCKVDLNPLHDWLEKYNKEHKIKIGYTVFLLKILGKLFEKYSTLNGTILFGYFFKKTQIDISCMISTENDCNAEILTIKECDKVSLEEISEKIKAKQELINKNLENNINRRKFFLNLLPTFFLAPFLSLMTYLTAYGANLSWFGLPKYNYGPAIVVNYGKKGLEDTFLPIPGTFFINPYSFHLCTFLHWPLKNKRKSCFK